METRQYALSVAKAPQARRSRFYLVTITYNPTIFISKDFLDSKFDDVVSKLRKYQTEWSCFKGYELKRNTLHMHTICSCQRSPWYQPSKNWNVQLKNFPEADYDNVVRYIQKQDQTIAAIQQREYESYLYNTEDLFTD